MLMKDHNSALLIKAAIDGNAEEVRRLIPLSDPKGDGATALLWAAVKGHAQCVQLLIPVSDPKAGESEALRLAAQHKHIQCMEMLYPFSDPVIVLQKLQSKFPNDNERWRRLRDMVEAEWLNTTLHKEIGNASNLKIKRKRKI